MKSILLKVDHFDTVKACMIECMKVQNLLSAQKIKVEVKTHRANNYRNHIYGYEIIFKNEEDYNVYQIIK